MLAAITLTLNQCTRADMATPAALALQGLQELCRAEVTHTHTPSQLFTVHTVNVATDFYEACFAGSGHHLNMEKSRARAEL